MTCLMCMSRTKFTARATPLEKGSSNRQLKYTVMKRKQSVSFLAGLVVRIILITSRYQFNSNFPAETLVTVVPLQKKIRFCTAFWMSWTKYDHNKIHTIRQNARNTLLLLILLDPQPVPGMAGHPRYWLPSLFIR
jgi:hypothetical protein